MKLTIGQINTSVGDIKANLNKVLEYYSKACAEKSDIIAFPELTLCGYPIQDQAQNQQFLKDVTKAIRTLKAESKTKYTAMIVGAPILRGNKILNAAFFIYKGEAKIITKHALPNYGVFDEKRVFSSTRKSLPIDFKGKKIGILICEDIWDYKTPNSLASDGADLLIAINSSPFDSSKFVRRINIVSTVQNQTNLPILYVNQVGGQDGLVFDGGSFFLGIGNTHKFQPVFWEEHYQTIDTEETKTIKINSLVSTEEIYNALVLGLRDYFYKTGFKKAILGSSGGIDSALVATIACDALGHENIYTYMLKSKYTSTESKTDATNLAKNLGCNHLELSIEASVDTLTLELQKAFDSKKVDLTEENLQARIRGIMLMALSNKNGALVLATGNKSEYATGYATLYGDMCGSYAPIKDVYKTLVFELSKWRNANIPKLAKLNKKNLIPHNILTKEPTAELKDNQKDSDSLPKYELLDGILYHIIEQDLHPKGIKGYDKKIVEKVYRMLKNSEYKRKQSTIGTKISTRDLYLERRYPIANSY